MICFTESELQQHEELIITRALAAKDLAIAQANRHKEELFQKLAEKDREIAKWRRIRTPTHGNCCTCQRCGLDHDSCRCDLDDVCDELDQLKKAYRQLMEQAVRFAELAGVRNACKEAYDFLQSPEVQAWKERQK